MAKTNLGLVEYAKKSLGNPYWLGGFGQRGSEDLWQRYHKQYPSTYTDATKPSYVKQYGKVVHDCNGLIKGYFWKDSFEGNYKYESNGLSDINEAQMYYMCKERGKIATIPEIQGIFVFLLKGGVPYHIGVYIRNGEVIEARGHDYGVIKSQLNVWHEWGKFPLLTYESAPSNYNPIVYEWQINAIKDGFAFEKYGADGEWGAECESVAKKDLIQQWADGKFRYPNTTRLAQQLLGMPASEWDGLCGAKTTKAIKEYQKAHNLTADGGIGAKTWSYLLGAKK